MITLAPLKVMLPAVWQVHVVHKAGPVGHNAVKENVSYDIEFMLAHTEIVAAYRGLVCNLFRNVIIY